MTSIEAKIGDHEEKIFDLSKGMAKMIGQNKVLIWMVGTITVAVTSAVAASFLKTLL